MLHRVKKKHDIHQDKWTGVGGKLEKGETPEECAIREVKEETGLTVKHLKLVGIITEPKFDRGGNDWYVFVFVIDDFSGELMECEEGELEWIDNDKLVELNLWPTDKLFIPWTFENKFFSAKFVYDNKQYVSHSVVFHE